MAFMSHSELSAKRSCLSKRLALKSTGHKIVLDLSIPGQLFRLFRLIQPLQLFFDSFQLALQRVPVLLQHRYPLLPAQEGMSTTAGVSPARMARAVMLGRRIVAGLVTSAILTRAGTMTAGM